LTISAIVDKHTWEKGCLVLCTSCNSVWSQISDSACGVVMTNELMEKKVSTTRYKAWLKLRIITFEMPL